MTSKIADQPLHVRIKRAYDAPEADDGYRVFVDRLWPRGVAKEDFQFDEWNKELAPSPALRTWFGHKVENWKGFGDSYQQELHTPEQKKRMQDLIAAAKGKPITLVYAAKDIKHNHALILANEINGLY
ncbi:DUF488 family protein [Alcaligenaceae bacterium]|nr:DUF488 family protein [Alcaligenaceae bacterium]